MIDANVQYDEAWYRSLGQYHPFNETAFFAILAHFGRPKTYLDIGCGDGWMLHWAQRLNIAADGIEQSDAARRLYAMNVSVLDLRKSFQLPTLYELVTCLEVVEHIEPEYALQAVANIANHVDKWLVFSAAAPGQNGHGHVNCQPQEYWRDLFYQVDDLVYDADKSAQLRETWKWTTGPLFWLPQNVQVFRRDD